MVKNFVRKVFFSSWNKEKLLLKLVVQRTLMPCPSMGPKWFWTIQIILVEYQLYWTGPIRFGQAQIILDMSKLWKKIVQKSLIWPWPKWYEPTKTIWTKPKQFVPVQNNLDGPKSFWTYRKTRHNSALIKDPNWVKKRHFITF